MKCRHINIPLTELKARYENGESTRELSRSLGVHRVTIARRLRSLGVKFRRPGGAGGANRIDAPWEDIKRRYDQGEQLTAIAAELGCDKSTVSRHIKELRQDELEGDLNALGVDRQTLLSAKAREDFLLTGAVARYQNGETIATLAEELGRSKATISRRLKDAGVKLRGTGGVTGAKPIKTRWSEVKRRYEGGETLASLAKDLGCNKTTVSANLQLLGTVIRRRGGHNRYPREVTRRRHSIAIKLYFGHGLSMQAVADKLGCATNTVRMAIKDSGFPARRRQPKVVPKKVADKKTLMRRVKAGYAAGKSSYALAKETGWSAQTIVNLLRKAGIELRGRGPVSKADMGKLKAVK